MSNRANAAESERKLKNGDHEVENNPGKDVPPMNQAHSPQDYSDVASVGSQQSSSQRRRHRRGGRKNNGKAARSQAASESHKPWSERKGRLDAGSESHPASEDEHDGQNEEETSQPSQETPSGDRKFGPIGVPTAFETGVRSFNLKRATGSGTGRPFGVTVEGEKANGGSKKSKGKKKSKKETEDDGDGASEEGAKSEKQRPFAIRLDLNLELEIFLRAKIKGDVTITFL